MELCPITAIEHYLDMTKPWRSKGETQLLLCHINPHKPASKAAIAGWIKEVLTLSGINIEVFQAHSVRGASSSKGKTLGASVSEILSKGNWRSESVWQKHYHKPILRPQENYQS